MVMGKRDATRTAATSGPKHRGTTKKDRGDRFPDRLCRSKGLEDTAPP
jgi:hypothetical protein